MLGYFVVGVPFGLFRVFLRFGISVIWEMECVSCGFSDISDLWDFDASLWDVAAISGILMLFLRF